MKMRYFWIIVCACALLAVGCGDNNSNTNKRGAPSTTNTGQNTNNGSGPSCQTRADCNADQECVDGTCQNHWQCDTAREGSSPSGACAWEWLGCNGKDYRVSCGSVGSDMVTVQCECFVNDVSTGTFSADASKVCEMSQAHREANDNCGWLAPQIF